MKKIKLTYEELFKKLGLNDPVDKDTLYSNIPDMFIDTPYGKTKILGLIKKPKQEYMSLNIQDIENEVQVSPYHIYLDENSNEVFAKDASYMQTKNGVKKILKKHFHKHEDELYDISILNESAPDAFQEIYVDANGVYNHNSFIGLKLAKNAQKRGMEVIFIDTEFAFDFDFAKNVGIDADKILVIQDNQLEEVQTTVMNIKNEYTEEERNNLLVIIDSWGGLVTSKTVDDATVGKDVMDMTISKKKNSFARLMMGLKTTIFVINHIYDCATENTFIQTPNGSISIKDLNIGDKVLTINGYEEVQNKFEYKDANVYEVELDDGTVLEVTEGHKFVIPDEAELGEYRWVEAGKLIHGAELIDIETLGDKIPKEV